MEMLYHIKGLCPRTDIDLGRYGFLIDLYPGMKRAVARSGIGLKEAGNIIKNCHRSWLDGCGYGQIYDPDVSPCDEWEAKHLGKTLKPGPNAHPLYDAHSIRVSWGEWGCEHIDVPGDACGLDIDTGMAPIVGKERGRVLVPHNIDSFSQVILLLTVFTSFMDCVIGECESKPALTETL